MCRGYTVPFPASNAAAAAAAAAEEHDNDLMFEPQSYGAKTRHATSAMPRKTLMAGKHNTPSNNSGSDDDLALQYEVHTADNNTIVDAPPVHVNNHHQCNVPTCDLVHIPSFACSPRKVDNLPPLAFLKVAPQKAMERSDLDMQQQRKIVAQDRADKRAAFEKEDRRLSLYGKHAPLDCDKPMSYTRHSLRQLVLEARNHQLAHAAKPAQMVRHHGRSPQRRPQQHQTQNRIPPPRPHQPPREPPMDLKDSANFRGLLHDIDHLMEVAEAKAHFTRERILTQTFEQLSRLRIWVADEQAIHHAAHEDELDSIWSAANGMGHGSGAGNFP